MAVYSVNKLIEQARKLAANYKKTTGKALPGISNEIAEHDAAQLLDLELSDERQDGYDAIGRGSREGKRILIKARTIFDETKSGQRIGNIGKDKVWDSVVLVLMDENYKPYELYEAERADLVGYLEKCGESRKKRGALSVARFRIVGKLVWSSETGPVDEVWDNRPS
ncbi:MAG: hypothetical protein ABFS02_07265 [Pseudomonadota bacterium]